MHVRSKVLVGQQLISDYIFLNIRKVLKLKIKQQLVLLLPDKLLQEQLLLANFCQTNFASQIIARHIIARKIMVGHIIAGQIAVGKLLKTAAIFDFLISYIAV